MQLIQKFHDNYLINHSQIYTLRTFLIALIFLVGVGGNIFGFFTEDIIQYQKSQDYAQLGQQIILRLLILFGYVAFFGFLLFRDLVKKKVNKSFEAFSTSDNNIFDLYLEVAQSRGSDYRINIKFLEKFQFEVHKKLEDILYFQKKMFKTEEYKHFIHTTLSDFSEQMNLKLFKSKGGQIYEDIEYHQKVTMYASLRLLRALEKDKNGLYHETYKKSYVSFRQSLGRRKLRLTRYMVQDIYEVLRKQEDWEALQHNEYSDEVFLLHIVIVSSFLFNYYEKPKIDFFKLLFSLTNPLHLLFELLKKI